MQVTDLPPEIFDSNNRYPVPFKCIIKPRTSAAEALIRDSVNDDEGC